MPNDLFIETPNPKQIEFFKAKNRFIAYGGARGGGKSWAVRKKAVLLATYYPGIKIMLLRRTIPQLRENHILPLRAELQGIAKYKETEHALLFPNGSRIKFGYCDSENDVLQYQGQEYDIIFLDEATQFTEYQFQTLTACIRGANHFPKRMYLTCNPGGVGHAWVMRLFIDRNYKNKENPNDYIFIPARVYDNKALLDRDPDYVKTLENLPHDLKEAWLNGNWKVFEGQYFKEFDESVHVIKSFDIPKHWRRYLTIDYGLDMLAAYWVAINEQNKAYVYRELYTSGLIISEAAQAIKAVEGDDNIYARIAPPDLFNRRQDTGRSAIEIFSQHGLSFSKAQNDRVLGWYELKEWLKPYVDADSHLTARLLIFENCHNLIRTLPMLCYDTQRPNDVSPYPHELTHAPDAIRYFVSFRPKSQPMVVPKKEPEFQILKKPPHPFSVGDDIDKSYINY